ncbi:MAG: hypothetical protein ACRES2_03430 [Steroidobacteraceae bacterium]
MRILAASFLALAPIHASLADDTPTDSNDKSVAQTAREFGQAVGRDAKAVGQAVKEGAKDVAAASKRGATRVRKAVTEKDTSPGKDISKDTPKDTAASKDAPAAKR